MLTEMKKYWRKFQRTDDGGWLEVGAELPKLSTAKIKGCAIVCREAAARMFGGEFSGGTFWGGTFWGGKFTGGYFWGGEFTGGTFTGGTFRGGKFRSSPCAAQRHDGYTFVAKHVDGELRIWAGCRNFSWDQAVSHWNDAHSHGAESQRIIHFLKAQAEDELERDKPRGETEC